MLLKTRELSDLANWPQVSPKTGCELIDSGCDSETLR
jgi:hypothetical protein